MGISGRADKGRLMNEIELRVILPNDSKVMKINKDNEWLAALLSGEAFKDAAPSKKKSKPLEFSSPQRRAIGK